MILKKFIINFLIISIILLINGCIEEETTNGKYDIYVGANLNNGYSTIQKAIENSSNGDSIFIYDGLYNENIIINKSINITGESNDKTIINYMGNQDQEIIFITLLADNCIINNINLNNSYGTDNVLGIVIKSSNNTIINTSISNTEKGIFIDSDYNVNSRNNSIILNNISNNNYGLHVTYSDNNNISKNNIFNNNEYGIYMLNSNNTTVFNNRISRSDNGLYSVHSTNDKILSNTIIKNIEYGVYMLSKSDDNLFKYNQIAQNNIGLRIKGSQRNNFENNIIQDNEGKGFYFCCGARNNIVFNNSIINNTPNVDDHFNNQWFYNEVGNYWSDYEEKYPSSIDENDDGFWDTPYLIYENTMDITMDMFPLIQKIQI